MANLKEIRTRIRSVISTQQTTKAMKMVSAAKLRRAQEANLNFRPYALKLNALLGSVASALKEATDLDLPYLTARPVNRVLYVLVTSNRGLAGAFNTAICKTLEQHLGDHHAALKARGDVHVLCVGKKGYDYFRRRGYTVVGDQNHDLFAGLSFAQTASLADAVMQRFAQAEYDQVYLVFNEFVNVATQRRVVENYLPMRVAEGAPAPANVLVEPDPVQLGLALVPYILKAQLQRAVLESHASEHGARMLAMDNATENAEELLRQLRLTYNKARQAAITTEILEIVSGAEALQSN